jgi:hypothetical protein
MWVGVHTEIEGNPIEIYPDVEERDNSCIVTLNPSHALWHNIIRARLPFASSRDLSVGIAINYVPEVSESAPVIYEWSDLNHDGKITVAQKLSGDLTRTIGKTPCWDFSKIVDNPDFGLLRYAYCGHIEKFKEKIDMLENILKRNSGLTITDLRYLKCLDFF